MSKWEMVKLGQVCHVNPPKKEILDKLQDKDVSFIPMASVDENGNIDTRDVRHYSEVSNGFSYFIENDILFAKITPCMENGKGAIARGLVNGVGVGSTEFHVLRPDEKYTISEWIYRFLAYSKTRKVAEKNMTGSAGQKRVPKSFLENLGIPLPPLDIQKHIADTLDKTQEIIDGHKKQLEELDNLIKATFYEMFGDPVINGKGFKFGKIKDYFDVKSGSTPSRECNKYWDKGTIPWIKTTEIKEGSITECEEYITKLAADECRLTQLPVETILVAMYGQGQTRGRTAKLMISATTNQACAALIKKSNEVNVDFVWRYLMNSYEQLRALGRGGNQPNLNKGLVENFEILVPNLDLQTKFAQIVTNIEQQKTIVKQSLTESQNLFNSLMSKYFD